MTDTPDSPLTAYEKHIAQLESVITALESGELSLDDALRQYEQGIALVRQCQQALTFAEQKIQQLTSAQNGEMTLQPFNEDTPTS